MFAAYALVKPALSLTGLAALVGWRMTLTTAVLYLILVLPLGVLLLVRPLLDYRAVQKRMGERITVDMSGLVFEDGAGRVEAAWADVTGYGVARAGTYTVETRGGAFEFLGSLGQSALLKEVIRLYATQASDRDWKARADAEALGGEAARWSGGRVGIGARVFHYQTRGGRTILISGLILFLVCCAVTALSSLANAFGSPTAGASAAGGLAVDAGFAVSGAFWLWYGWRYYRRAGIHLDEDGLTQWAPLGRERVPWAQVCDFYPNFSSDGSVICYVVKARNGRCVRFGRTIVGRDELRAEVVRRAAHCGRTAWGPRPPA